MSISSSQTKAIMHEEGPAIVVAGPGSGKTLVITNRIQYLIEKKGVRPEEILVITFTKAAALQMKKRFQTLTDGRNYRVNFGTFHAVFFQILKYAYHYNSENILRDEQRYQILSGLADAARLEYEDQKEMVSKLAGEISIVKNERIPLEHYYSGTCGDSTFRDIYRGYEKALQNQNLIDFDDMMGYTYELFLKRTDILAQWQKHFRWILVDEFQDINALQYAILKKLALPGNNLFVVGDDDQSIYRFRGAKPEIMLGFQKDYPRAKVLHLQENYRCSGAIVQAADQVISQNKVRYEKRVSCIRETGASVDIRGLTDIYKQARLVISGIRNAADQGVTLDDVAVLTRTNTGGRFLAERLMEYEIPFYMIDSVPDIYDHWIAQDIFAYIKLGMGIRERKDFLRIMNRPVRYISRECVDLPKVDFNRLRLWYEDKPWMIRRLDELEENLETIGRVRPYAAVNYIRSGCNYDKYIEDYASQRRIQKEELYAVADEIQESARQFKTFRDWFDHIDAYRKKLEEQKKERFQRKKDQPAVSLMTMHSSKGLEFEEVFLIDLNEGTIPHRKAVLEADIEEERRLLYVGMTRAKKKLHMYYVKERFGKELDPSRFLEALDVM